MTGEDLAAAALTLVGTRFRLHGRDPAHGLDCIGLLHAALCHAGSPIELPTGYPLRLSKPDLWLPDVRACGFVAATPPFEPGHVILIAPAVGQVHLAIAGRNGTWVHAHAGLRRVVIAPCLPTGAILHHWRLLPPS